jgi:hypothetical protein
MLGSGKVFSVPTLPACAYIEYDAATNRYILYERVGNLYTARRNTSLLPIFKAYRKSKQRNYYKQLADNYAYDSQQPGFIPVIKVRSRTFEQILAAKTLISVRRDRRK